MLVKTINVNICTVLTCIKHPLLGAVDPSPPRRCIPGAGQMPLLRAVVAREAADHGEGLTHPLTPKRGRRFHGDFNGKHREIYSFV